VAVNVIKEKYSNRINEVVIGAGPNAVKVGGDGTLPFLFFEGEMPNRPLAALEVWDIEPKLWPEILTSEFTGVLSDPVAWAGKCEEYGADLICLTLMSSHPDNLDSSPAQCAKTARAVAGAVKVPLIIMGCGVEEKDVRVIGEVCKVLEGRNCLVGCAKPDNYKTITASCVAHGHSLIASNPLDINIAKQLNILITEMGLPPNRIVIDPLVGSLGYGLEYAYSIMERIRISGLSGDKMLAMPVFCQIGQEVWKTKEACSPVEETPEWGDQARRAVAWEVVTAATLAQAGGSIMVMRHPVSLKQFLAHLKNLME